MGRPQKWIKYNENFLKCKSTATLVWMRDLYWQVQIKKTSPIPTEKERNKEDNIFNKKK